MLTCWNLFRSGSIAAGKWLFTKGRWKIALLVLGVLLSVLAIRGCTNAREDADAAQRAAQAAQEQVKAGEEARLAADRAVTGATAAKAAITDKEIAGNARMETVLDAHEEWAAQPVPTDVLDSLRD